ncbi:MAG: SGNH/GDSL hydrolase family protein [Cyanophyceae cyanobacterium]
MTSIDQIYFFGASTEDNGNEFNITDQRVPPSPPYFDGRFSNGPLWTEYLVEDLRPQTEVPFPVAPHLNVNYAIGGAQTGDQERGLLMQVDEYVKDIDRAELFGQEPNSSDDLYVISSNPLGNDVINLGADLLTLLEQNPDATPEELNLLVQNLIENTVLTAVSNLATAITTLHEKANAEQFLVLNSLDLEFFPAGRNFLASLPGGGQIIGEGALTTLTVAYNNALAMTLNNLELALGIEIVEYDLFSLENEFIASFDNSSDPYLTFSNQEPVFAEGSPENYVFWDDGHLTTDAYALLADSVADTLADNAVGDTLFEDFEPDVAINDIRGSRGDDFIEGSRSNDRIVGDNGNDTITGGRGNDIITGGRGGDDISGGRGNDILAADRIDRFDDYDGDVSIISGGRGSDIIYGGRKNDTLKGGRGDDVLFGKSGDDRLRGNRGNDLLNGGVGNDTINGGDGTDTADYSDLSFAGVFGSVAGLDVNLERKKAVHSSTNNSLRWSDTLRHIENVIGTSTNDRFIGNGSDNVFDGQGEVGRDDRQTHFTALDGETYRVTADVVEYSGSQSDYIFMGSADNFTAAGDSIGRDTLLDIEFVRFNADRAVVATADLSFS